MILTIILVSVGIGTVFVWGAYWEQTHQKTITKNKLKSIDANGILQSQYYIIKSTPPSIKKEFLSFMSDSSGEVVS